MKSKAPQLHLEYRFYKVLGTTGKYNFAEIVVRRNCLCIFWKQDKSGFMSDHKLSPFLRY